MMEQRQNIMYDCLVGDYNHCLSMQPQTMQLEVAFNGCNNNNSSNNNELWNTDKPLNLTWKSNSELPYHEANLIDTTSMLSFSQSTSSTTIPPLSPSSSKNDVVKEQLLIQQNNGFNTLKTCCGTNIDHSSSNNNSQTLEYSTPCSFYFPQMMEAGDECMFYKNGNHTPVGYMDIHPNSKYQDNKDFSGFHSSRYNSKNNQQGRGVNVLTHANSSDYKFDRNTIHMHHKIHHIKNDDSREKRRKQNRVAAQRFRERKKYKIFQLLKVIQSLQAAYTDVKNQLLELQKEKVRLRRHVIKSCRIV